MIMSQHLATYFSYWILKFSVICYFKILSCLARIMQHPHVPRGLFLHVNATAHLFTSYFVVFQERLLSALSVLYYGYVRRTFVIYVKRGSEKDYKATQAQ